MKQSIFIAKAGCTEGEMLDDAGRSLSMDGISVGEGIFQTRDNTVDIVFAHLSNIFEQERHCLETSVADVQVWCAVLVQDCWYAGEGTTGFLRRCESQTFSVQTE